MLANPHLLYREDEPVSFGFTEKLEEGERGELFIASQMARFGKVHLVTDLQMQRIGIDAFLISKRLGYVSMQFKRCSRAGTSGNAFIETGICNELKEETSLGWALKTIANSTVYWAVGTGKMYLIDTMKMKLRLQDWGKRYRVGFGCSKEYGRTWYGRGVLVPLEILQAEVCTKVLLVNEEREKF